MTEENLDQPHANPWVETKMTSSGPANPGCTLAIVNGKTALLPGDTHQEAEDYLRLSYWLCGKNPPKIEWPYVVGSEEQ